MQRKSPGALTPGLPIAQSAETIARLASDLVALEDEPIGELGLVVVHLAKRLARLRVVLVIPGLDHLALHCRGDVLRHP